ncbi:uncharacterized protein G2W53_037627 [Senna tora]|uniref:Uncharacterized protein n=1 Tax=Senna tora TaxID=362788 RepID=A0A834SL94_9FABA|nr:uncharacterized protein G2W53_037627 [Senna tora]
MERHDVGPLYQIREHLSQPGGYLTVG